MTHLDVTADSLVDALLRLSESETVCVLDSCGVGHLGSHRLIAGIRPINTIELNADSPDEILGILDREFGRDHAAIFALSYDFGNKLQRIPVRDADTSISEPDVFVALFDAVVVHDYESGSTTISGDPKACRRMGSLLTDAVSADRGYESAETPELTIASSNFSRAEYIRVIEAIREQIRCGETYQTNLTQQIRCELPKGLTPQAVYWRLRRDHPAPFSAFVPRSDSTVVSASPERFFRITRDNIIEASPIKGTRKRGSDRHEDDRLRSELLSSLKDRAENTMIVDLVRNDIGRVCEFGSVSVEKLCDLEEHPTLFHLVSTVRGRLLDGMRLSDILRATFPCGSITGAPKIRTMRIIDELEPAKRGLSMGTIGCYIPDRFAAISESIVDLNVAIRTMVISGREVVFNVGGGIVIDSDPAREYEESILKAQALLKAIGAELKS